MTLNNHSRGICLRALMEKAVQYLRDNHVEYGDVRIGFYRNQDIAVRNNIPINLTDSESIGFGIRAFLNGYWGFYSGLELELEAMIKGVKVAVEIARAGAKQNEHKLELTPVQAYDETWQVSFKQDPFQVSMGQKVNLLLNINAEMMRVNSIKQAFAAMNFSREHKLFCSTVGTFTDQLLLRANCEYTATAVSDKGFESRTFHDMPLNIGFEHIDDRRLLSQARTIAEQAVEKLNAPFCPEMEADLVLLPNHTALVIHETIGHATELDRVLGWEADFAGTSFATTDKLGSLRYGSELFSVTGDRTIPHGRATVAFDDDGVPTGRWFIIRNGVLESYATTRDTAGFINDQQSHGCSYADSWNSMPILRMPNVSIEPGPDGSPGLDEIIASTDKGILVEGRGSYSIDHQRINFQFGGDYCRLINNGKVGNVIRRMTYQSHNPVFWNSVDAIAPKEQWQQFGVVNCGKGQPTQRAQLTHGSAPLRLRQIKIGRARI